MPALILIAIWLLAIIGWIANVVQVIGLAMADGEITTMFVFKCVSIFLGPVGSVMGWIGMFS